MFGRSPGPAAPAACTCTSASTPTRRACGSSTGSRPWLPVHPGDQRELAVLRGSRHRLRVVALAGLEPLAERRADRAVRLRRGLPGGRPRSWSSSAPPATRGCSTTTPGWRWTTRPSRSGCPTSAPTRRPACWSPPWSAGWSRPPRPPTTAQDPWRVEMVRAAQWRASRYGVSERLVHPLERTPRPAREVVQSLVDTVRPALEEAGDLDFVTEGGRERPACAVARSASVRRTSAAATSRASSTTWSRGPRRPGSSPDGWQVVTTDRGSVGRMCRRPGEAPYRLNRGHERRAPSPSPHPGRHRHRRHVHRRRRLRRGQRRAGHHEDPEHPEQPRRRVHGRHREGARPDGPPAR